MYVPEQIYDEEPYQYKEIVLRRRSWRHKRLAECDKIKRLDFGVNDRIKANLSAAARVGYLPISFNHLKAQNRQLADLISSQMKKSVS